MAEAHPRDAVPLSQPLRHETARHFLPMRDSRETAAGTPDLKALARLVMARDTGQDAERDRVSRFSVATETPERSVSAFSSKLAGKQAHAARILDTSDLRDRYEERASIVQFDGREDRPRAEARAWNEVAGIWHRRYGEKAPQGRCAGCGKALGTEADVLLLPHGARAHAGLEYCCITAYSQRWKREAAGALEVIGIPTPAEIEAEIKGAHSGTGMRASP